MRMGPQLEFAIYRIDDARYLIHGWLVKLSRRKVAYCKLFSDATCHGEEGALAAARTFRDGITGTNSRRRRPATCPTNPGNYQPSTGQRLERSA